MLLVKRRGRAILFDSSSLGHKTTVEHHFLPGFRPKLSPFAWGLPLIFVFNYMNVFLYFFE